MNKGNNQSKLKVAPKTIFTLPQTCSKFPSSTFGTKTAILLVIPVIKLSNNGSTK
jgi:hypothetical protein